MPSDVLAHLYELAKQGATIVFLENYPTDVPGYGQLEQKRKSYQQTLKNLPAVSFSETTVTPIGKGKIITGTDYARTLASCNIPAEEMKTKFGLQTIRRVNNTGHHYFISSLQNKGVDGWITLGTNAETAALFNPMTGECGEAKVRQVDGKTQVYLQLKSGESIILQTYRQPLQASKPWKYVKEQPFSLRLDHGWKLHFAESTPEIQGTFDIDRPCSWTNIDHPAAQTNMGTGVYSLDIELPALKADNWILDLGDVRESARVRINGQEAGGGSIRIHTPEMQHKMFEILGMSEETIKNRFGFFVDAFKYGAPPHGGLAFGLDRLTMLLTGDDNIKDVIAFPKVQNASCLMTGAPDFVEDVQLNELGLAVPEEK